MVVFKKPASNAEFDILDLGDAAEPEPEEEDAPPSDAPAEASAFVKPGPGPMRVGAMLAAAAQQKHEPAQKDTDFIEAFGQNMERMQKFVRLCLRYTNSHGELKRAHCMHILNESFGIAEHSLKTVFDSLIGTGHLHIVQNLLYVRLDEQWLRKHFADSAPAKPSVTPTQSPAPSNEAPSLAASIAKLSEVVATEERLRARLVEITSKDLPEIQKQRDGLDAQIAALEERRRQLSIERNSLSQALENPKFKKARTELSAIEAILKPKK